MDVEAFIGRSGAVTLGILLVVAAILVVGGVLFGTYKLVSRLPRDDDGGNGEGDAG